MNTQYTHKQALSNGTDNQPKLGEAWIAFVSDPVSRKQLNRLADALDRVLQTYLPEQTLHGILNGREREIQQDANILLLEKMLTGNLKLSQATQTGMELRVENQIRRSISAAVKFSKRRTRRALVQEAERRASLPPHDARCGQICHPSDRSLYALPYPVLRELALAVLKASAEQNRLSLRCAALAVTMIEEGLSQAEMARRLKISRSAVNQRLASVRKYLLASLQTTELPNDRSVEKTFVSVRL